MYKTYTILVRSTNKEFLKYCSDSCQMAKLFRNSVIFRCRQLITAHYKLLEDKALTDNEKHIPHSVLANKIQSIGASYGIQVEIVEESYTSQASSIDGDTIPTYIKDDKTKYTFSGKRTKRGLYKAREGIKMNADVNGATNIIRKHIPFAFDKITDFSYLTKQVKILAC